MARAGRVAWVQLPRWRDLEAAATPAERRAHAAALAAVRVAHERLLEVRKVNAEAERTARREVHEAQVATNALLRRVARRVSGA
jgi:hypothetical protein